MVGAGASVITSRRPAFVRIVIRPFWAYVGLERRRRGRAVELASLPRCRLQAAPAAPAGPGGPAGAGGPGGPGRLTRLASLRISFL